MVMDLVCAFMLAITKLVSSRRVHRCAISVAGDTGRGKHYRHDGHCASICRHSGIDIAWNCQVCKCAFCMSWLRTMQAGNVGLRRILAPYLYIQKLGTFLLVLARVDTEICDFFRIKERLGFAMIINMSI
ncbi:uncharacterized protein PHALS_14735 [Plasmopara halstedii]|uniref:Secreted protein n=1 Tax=Plasmopara halstedii TaxID=4781 RepID=A0A0P1A523_PLAHL|nr:uncharacterized protein PHALS_14735 [Plasmopara halstedii]CEG35183.1 hypothetical protein PHALS_14735 [Plasmopara halstedii]|eukprot:XP_024571552.1 hypothetical protein PHALS_14735 [Plasmopara halstedii]